MNKTGPLAFGFIGIIVLIAVGCATAPTRLEADYGTSYHLATFQQILDREAEKTLAPVYGLDGMAAQAALQKYRGTFEKPPAPPPFVISIGQTR